MRPLALTMGDPAGIGGEISLKAWLGRAARDVPPFFLIDDPDRLESLARRLDWPVKILPISEPEETSEAFDRGLPVLARPLPGQPVPGAAGPQYAAAVIAAIDEAVEFVQTGQASALVTNPIHKQTLLEAGFQHAGHTNYLAELAGDGSRAVMMLACSTLRVIPVCVHLSLHDSIAALTAEAIVETTRITAAALQEDFGIDAPHIVISGLNPHAGEGGALGREEIEIIRPAIEQLKQMGLSIRGPEPADTLFHERARLSYDAAICMYHDQALIPIKTIDFNTAVNITLGLPFIRTSPDHGTAFEIAGTGVADESSLIAALQTAAAMAKRRQAKPAQNGQRLAQ